MEYTENNFNKKDNEYTNKIKILKRSTMFAENESKYNIDGTNYPVSTIWRDVAITALELANYADWFDRYDQKNNSRKD